MSDENLDFTVVARAGLTQREFAALVGVSRVTTNLWVSGKMNPHRLIRARAVSTVAVLEKAILNAKLPLPQSIKATERPAALACALRANPSHAD